MSLFQKQYELPLVRGYVAHWGLHEAVRELLQNALDSDSPFRCTYMDGTLRVISSDSSLSPRTLLLGSTSKANDENTIGSFGEGYKIAMLVLTRLERRVTIYNDKVVWSPQFMMSKSFGEETLHVLEDKRVPGWEDRLIFEITDVTEDEWKQVKRDCLHLWEPEDFGEVLDTRYGRILTQHRGKIYVNGLFICEMMDLDHSYDIKPAYITLERDRQTVSSWDVKVLAKDMWFDTKNLDRVAEMIDEGVTDLVHADYSTPELVKEACYKLFKEKHPDKVAVSSQAELDTVVKGGMINVVVVNRTQHDILRSHPEYKRAEVVRKVVKPIEVLTQWFRENRGYMRKEAIVNFKELSQKAESWSSR